MKTVQDAEKKSDLVKELKKDDGDGKETGETTLDVAVDLGEVTEVHDADDEQVEVKAPGGLLTGGEAGAGEVCLQEWTVIAWCLLSYHQGDDGQRDKESAEQLDRVPAPVW